MGGSNRGRIDTDINTHGSFFYFIVGTHALHAVAALAFMAYMVLLERKGKLDAVTIGQRNLLVFRSWRLAPHLLAGISLMHRTFLLLLMFSPPQSCVCCLQ